jgi:hypothetical protein
MDVGYCAYRQTDRLGAARAKMQHRENVLLKPVETSAREIGRRSRLAVALAAGHGCEASPDHVSQQVDRKPVR